MGSPLVINCTVSTVSGVESSSVMISWIGPGGGSIMNDSRVTISPTTSSNNYTSSLLFNYLMEGDEGTYTCNAVILETIVSQSVELELLVSKFSYVYVCMYICIYVAKQNHLGCKKVQGQSEATLLTGMCDQKL